MKYKEGDRVLIKSIDWYNENKNETDDIECSNNIWFYREMSKFCGKVMTISHVRADHYTMVEDLVGYWTDEMIECKVEEETKNWADISIPDRPYTVTYGSPSMNDSMNKNNIDNGIIILPEGYIFKDENGNVINTTKIILEKEPDNKLKLESTKKVREYWSEYARIYIEIYDDEPNECVLTHLYTLEGHRQKGYGRQALSEAEEIAKELSCHTAYLKVETGSWMHNWYLRCGYNWYKNADEGYTWLQKNL